MLRGKRESPMEGSAIEIEGLGRGRGGLLEYGEGGTRTKKGELLKRKPIHLLAETIYLTMKKKKKKIKS